jgi:hypothetical protein
MYTKLLFLLTLFFVLLAGGVEAQQAALENYRLNGRLLDAEDSTAIPFAHISNLSQNLRALSDSSGLFNIAAREGDSLQISSVSYGQKIIVAPAQPADGKRLLISLAPNVYELDEVVVRRFPTEREFTQQLLSMELPKEKGTDMRLPANLPGKPASADGSPTVAFGGAISGIAGKFSKKERGRVFAAEMKEKEERKAIIHTKFNREIVKRITGLEDEDQVDAFMQYCVLSEHFLYEASEYEIHKAVLGCIDDFMKEQEG